MNNYLTKADRQFIILILMIISLLVFVGLSAFKYRDARLNPMDCAPQTLHRIFPGYSIDDLMEICHTKLSEGTSLDDFNEAWVYLICREKQGRYNGKVDINDSLPVYSVIKTIPTLDENRDGKMKIEFGVPYVWLGKIPEGLHTAVIYFTSTNIIISHSQFIPGTTNFYCQFKDYMDVITNSYLIYRRHVSWDNDKI